MRYRPTRPSVVVATVAAVAVASPGIVYLAGSEPTAAVDARKPAQSSINEVALNSVPSVVVDLVRSGLSQVGVSLPPIDLSKVDLNALPSELSSLLPVLPGTPAPQTVPADPDPHQSTSSRPAQSTSPRMTSTPAPATRSNSAHPNRAPDSGVVTRPTAPEAPAAGELPTGAVVKEISQSKPFSMVALTWKDLAATLGKDKAGAGKDRSAAAEKILRETTAFVRAKHSDGSWGPWRSADALDGGPTKQKSAGTEPVWVGATKAVQVAVTRAGVATPGRGGAAVPTTAGNAPNKAEVPPRVGGKRQETVGPNDVAPKAFTAPMRPGDAPPPAAPTVPADDQAPASQPAQPDPLTTAASALKAALINPGTAATPGYAAAAPVTPGKQPSVISRAQWGADESLRCDSPTYDPSVKAAVVHHTAGSNDYTPQQSAEIVRGIYAYHAQTLGWCDIGYNALVDKYGQVFEGASGGLDRNVQGTHTGGFNENTVGVAMIGDYDELQPTPALLTSVGQYLGWRLKIAGLDPHGNSQLQSIGFDTAKYGAGEVTNLPTISGHRDYDNTECPGNLGYASLPVIRDIAAGNLSAVAPTPAVPGPGTANPAPAPDAGGALPIDDTGAIAVLWRTLGGPQGVLGKALTGENDLPGTSPTQPSLTPVAPAPGVPAPVATSPRASSEAPAPDASPRGVGDVVGALGKMVQFRNGAIYWSPETGAQVVQGAIGKAWSAAGAGSSTLGLPVGDETAQGNGFISQAFQFGSLIFTKATGVVVAVAKKFVTEFISKLLHPSPAPVPAGEPASGAATRPAPVPASTPAPVPASTPAR